MDIKFSCVCVRARACVFINYEFNTSVIPLYIPKKPSLRKVFMAQSGLQTTKVIVILKKHSNRKELYSQLNTCILKMREKNVNIIVFS
jgi:hypothetical protein